MDFLTIGISFVAGAVVASAVYAVWYKHNKKRLAKVLTFFDVQERLDKVLAMTELDEKLLKAIKDVRAKVDKII